MSRTRKVAALLGFAVAALIAGCSSETENDYVDTVNEIQTSALNAFNQAASSTPESKGAIVKQLEAGEDALAGAVSELESVDVPDDAADAHPKLVDGISDLRDLFARTARKVRAAEGPEALTAVNSLGSEGAVIGNEIDEAINQLNKDLGAS